MLAEIAIFIEEVHRSFPTVGVEIYQGGAIYTAYFNRMIERHHQVEGLPLKVVPLELITKPWYKAILVAEPDTLAEVELFVASRAPACAWVHSEPDYFELLPQNVSKGNALNKLATLLGCSQADTIAVGDNLNDLEMIRFAGTGIAVANAHPTLKASAKFTGVHHDADALAQIVEWIMEQKQLAVYCLKFKVQFHLFFRFIFIF